MSENIDKVLHCLDEMNIQYEVMYHPAVFTMDEMNTLGIFTKGVVPKNLFLRDAKGHRHFLITLAGHKKVDMISLQNIIGSSRLSFASDERLHKYLGLSKGMVSPLGVLNDDETSVEVFFDSELKDLTVVGVHPNDNTATVWLSFNDLYNVVSEHGNTVTIIDI